MRSSLSLDFFPCSNLQKKYFSRLSYYLNQDGIASRVIAYKWLGVLSFFVAPYALFQIKRNSALTEVVAVAMNEKRKNNFGRPSSLLKIRILSLWKLLEAQCLYLVYQGAFRIAGVYALGLWNGLKYRQAIAVLAIQAVGGRAIYFENGLVPSMTTVDEKGVNFKNSMPRLKEDYWDVGCHDIETEVPLLDLEEKKISGGYIFVPFQVDTDSQIVRFSPLIKNMDELYELLHETSRFLPEGLKYMVKLHPASSVDYSHLVRRSLDEERIAFTDRPTPELIDSAFGVLTINSTVGVEALLKAKRVITIGKAFYNIEGLVVHLNNLEKLPAALDRLKDWEVDMKTLVGFKNKIVEYQVPGLWQEATDSHLLAMKKRLVSMLGGEVQE